MLWVLRVSCPGVHCVGGSGLVRKRIRLNRKKPMHTLLVFGFNVVHVCGSNVPDPKRRCIDQDHADLVPAPIRTGVG